MYTCALFLFAAFYFSFSLFPLNTFVLSSPGRGLRLLPAAHVTLYKRASFFFAASRPVILFCLFGFFLHVAVSVCRYIYLHFEPSVNSLHSRKFRSCLRPATRCNLVFKNFLETKANFMQSRYSVGFEEKSDRHCSENRVKEFIQYLFCTTTYQTCGLLKSLII